MLDTITNHAEAAATVAGNITDADLEAAMKQASTAYSSARQNAATSAATVYYVWFHTCSKHAAQTNKLWYAEKSGKRSTEISTWNADLNAQKAAEEADNKSRLAKLREEKRKANSAARHNDFDAQIKAESDASKERLRALTAQRKVKLETRDGAAPFTEITKVVLALHQPKQGSQVNRFATVVKWIAVEFEQELRPNIAAIAERLLDKGGFDEVYSLQQKVDGKGGGVETKPLGGEDTSAREDGLRGAVVDHFRTVVASASGLGTLAFSHQRTQGSLVALIGRVGTDGVTVISEIGMPVEDVLDLCVQKQERKLLPGDAGCEFIAKVFAMGDLVTEGKRPAKDGDASDCTRELSMLVTDDERRLVISARNADVSVVVHATPKVGADGLLPKPGYWQLDRAEVNALKTRLADGVVRKMVSLRADETERTIGENMLTSEFAWASKSGPLAAKGDPAATLSHPWLAMSPYDMVPLDIDGFAPLGTVTLARDELMKLANGHIAGWKSGKAAGKASDKQTANATAGFTNSTVSVTCVQGTDMVPCTGSMKGTVSLTFRPRMLATALAKIAELCGGTVDLSPDDRGALRIAFEDDHGRYAVFVPACDKDNALDKTRFRAIRVPEADGE